MNNRTNTFKKTALASVITILAACGSSGSGSNNNSSSSATSHVFAATNGTDGTELFISNGTAAGTKMLKDINLNADSNPEQFIKLGDDTFFVADDDLHGEELWKTDGTEDGTVLLKDIEIGMSDSSPREITLFKDKLYFVAFNTGTRNELFVSDGTEDGTGIFVELIAGGALDGQISGLTVVGDNLLFSAVGPNNNGQELWKTDGTIAGTVIVKNINPGAGGVGSNPLNLTAVGDTLFFTADAGSGRTLWKSDGTEAGTIEVDPIGGSPNGFSDFTALGNNLFFSATTVNEGNELWVSDGTNTGTQMVKNIYGEGGFAIASVVFGNNSAPRNLTALGNEIFFTATNGANGTEIWKSDGTEVGTVMVKDIESGGLSSDPDNLTVINDALIFTAHSDGDNSIWRSDGTEAGTVSMIDTTASGDNNAFSSIGQKQYQNQSALMTSADEVLISAETENDDLQLYLTDGTSEGTTLVTLINEFGDAFYNNGGPH